MFEFFFEQVELFALSGDHRVGDFAFGFEVAVEVAAFLLQNLEVGLECGDAAECFGVASAGLGESHGHRFAFLFERVDALIEGLYFAFYRGGGELGAHRLEVGFGVAELGLERVVLTARVIGA